MRWRRVVVAALLPLTAACGQHPVDVASAEPSGRGEGSDRSTTRQECRTQWRDLASFHAENDNPRGPVPALIARWDELYAVAQHLAGNATRHDCGPVIDRHAEEWAALESVQHDLGRYDPLTRLAGAEGDREHALELSGADRLPPRLERQFGIARRHARPAALDLAPVLARYGGIDVTDDAAVAAAFADVQAAGDASRHLRRLERALRVIGAAELHEE